MNTKETAEDLILIAEDYLREGNKPSMPEPGPRPEPEPEPWEPAPGNPPYFFNAGAFYDYIRKHLFDGSLNQEQVDGHNLLGYACGIFKLDPLIEQSAYVLATTYWETGRVFQPIEEWGGWNTRYSPWFGRGYVQLTWEENYQKQQNKLGKYAEQLEQHNIPWRVHDDWNYALDAGTSAIITVGGMKDGDFTGVGLSNYINHSKVDYVEARRIVNGTDRQHEIAGYAVEYEKALRLGFEGV